MHRFLRHPLWATCGSAVLLLTLLAGVGVRPAAAAAVTSVRGEACSFMVNVGLFGGPQNLQGCGEAGRLPAGNPAPGNTDTSYSPHVRISGAGGSMTASDADGASGVYGPAVIHGGQWPCAETGDRNCPASAPPSGPQAAITSGSAATGTVTASADIRLFATPVPVTCYPGYGPSCYNVGGFGPFPSAGDSLHVQCSATSTSVTGSTTLSNAVLATTTDAAGEPLNQEPVPNSPPPNYIRHGVITNVGDVFSVVYNEQIVNADGSLTVNGVHMYLFGPTAVGELIRGQVTCGTTPTTVSPSDTVAPNCGTPVVKPVSPEDQTPLVPRQELVGAFDAGGIQSVTNVVATNGTVKVGDDSSSFAYLRFTPGQKGPLPVTATRTDAAEAAGLPLFWSFDVTDVSGNVTHCRGVLAPPVAVDDGYTTNEDTPLSVPAPGVLGNDTDADGDALTAGSASTPAHGTVTLNANGSFAYTPAANYNGPDSFTYVVNDGKGGTDTGLVTIAVAAVNDAPVAVDDSYGTSQNTALTVAAPGVLANDTDVDGGSLTAGSASTPAHGTVTLNANGSFTFTPASGYVGSDSFTYAVGDGQGGTDTGLVTITVNAGNTPPVAVDDSYSTSRDTALTVAAPGVLGNDTDANGGSLTAGSASTPAHGTVTLNANGSFAYTPTAGYIGSDSFTYAVGDGQGGTDTGLVTITVNSSNTPPVAVDDSYSTSRETALTVAAPGVLGNDTDANSDSLTAGSAGTPAHGTVTLNANGSFTYTPTAGYVGSDSFTYTVSDGHGGSDTGLVSLNVTAPPGVGFHSLTPNRILDSRPSPSQVGPYGTRWTPGLVRDVTVTGAGVPAGADAVVLNVTVTNTTAAGYLTIWPTGQPQPLASSLNWAPGQTIPNAVTVKVGAGGKVSVLNPVGEADVLVDLVGYYDATPGEGFTPLTPARILDSRPPPNQLGPYGTPWVPGRTRDMSVVQGGVPAGADAVVLNVTVTGTTGAGYLTVWPSGQAQPLASSLNWAPGQTIPNAVTVKVGAGGSVSVFNAVGNANVIVDVVGFFATGSGQLFHPLSPARIQDSRPSGPQVGPFGTPWGLASRDVAVSGAGGVPAGATAALLNVTVTNTSASSYLSIWPAGQVAPLASSLNWEAGVTIPNSVTSKLGAGGAISVQNAAGTADVIIDAAGWYG